MLCVMYRIDVNNTKTKKEKTQAIKEKKPSFFSEISSSPTIPGRFTSFCISTSLVPNHRVEGLLCSTLLHFSQQTRLCEILCTCSVVCSISSELYN